MKRTNIFKIAALPFFLGLIALSSCMDLSLNNDNFTTEEVNNLEVMKIGLNNTTETEYYEYICSEDTNHLVVGGPIDEGVIIITISDDNNDVIFNKKLSGHTTFDEDVAGISGIWNITLDYQKTRGNLSLSLRK